MLLFFCSFIQHNLWSYILVWMHFSMPKCCLALTAKCKTLDTSKKFLNSALLCTNNHFREQVGAGDASPLLSVIIAPPTFTSHLQCFWPSFHKKTSVEWAIFMQIWSNNFLVWLMEAKQKINLVITVFVGALACCQSSANKSWRCKISQMWFICTKQGGVQNFLGGV